MLKFLIVTVISLSAGVREPRQVPTAPFDYELSYGIETQLGYGGDLSFKHDYEREDGEFFNDIRAELNYSFYKPNSKINQCIIIKEDYKQITSKDLYQFNSDIRYQLYGISIGYGMIWDLENKYIFKPSAGFDKKWFVKGWHIEIENDVYNTKPITYQTEGKMVYDITNNIGLGLSANYIEAVKAHDYSAKIILTIKL